MSKDLDPESLDGGFNRHLGDGAYASFDGYQVWLAVNNHRNKLVALDSRAFDALLRWKADLDRVIAERVAQQPGGAP